MFIIKFQKWPHLYFWPLIYTPQNPFGFTRVPQNVRPQTYCFQFFSAVSNQGCPAPDTILSSGYSPVPQKISKCQGGKKYQDLKGYRGRNTCAEPCGFWASAGSWFPCSLLNNQRGAESPLAYKYLGELCDRVQRYPPLLQQPPRWSLPAEKPRVWVL